MNKTDLNLLNGKGFARTEMDGEREVFEHPGFPAERITYYVGTGTFCPSNMATASEGPEASARKAINWLVREREVKAYA